jgi:hypothetical protein
MAESTVKISDTMAWAKQMSWNRNSGIGNSLQPALSNAAMVMQTILAPPFDWWWNNVGVSFTCATGPASSAITNVVIAAGVVTLSTVNTWVQDQQVLVSGLVTATQLNGQLLTVLTATGSQITAVVSLPNYGTAADTGTLTNLTTQDYPVNVPNFSHIEHTTLLDNTAKGVASNPPSGKLWELSVKSDLSLDSNPGRPEFIATNTEDTLGNVTFRVMPAPNAPYPISVTVQLTAPAVTSLNQTWSPIPDYMQSIYNYGFLALTWIFADDPRAQWANQKFIAALLSRAQGLSEEDRNIFLNNWASITGMQQTTTQQGIQARGV